MTKDFKRKKENFICKNCGRQVKGDGYTNHCPKCLWSRHVDESPGDRTSDCKGMMKPVKIEEKSGGYDITHCCVKCGHEKKNKISPKDDFSEMLKI